jgi:hypothetical protein
MWQTTRKPKPGDSAAINVPALNVDMARMKIGRVLSRVPQDDLVRGQADCHLIGFGRNGMARTIVDVEGGGLH